ncbi:MAG: hypothetical protein ACYC63_05975 [Armatimonadota bacterium]
MRDLDAKDVGSLRGVVAFAVMSHVLDLITTQWRDPALDHEGNPFYQLAEHVGFTGWPWLVMTKVIIVGALGIGYWWYMRTRHEFLPKKIVYSHRALIWYGMWDGKPYPTSMFARLFNRRKFAFLGLVLGGLSLPGSGAAALFISLDNAAVALGRGIPMQLAMVLLVFTVVICFVWWYWAYWQYYKTQVRAGVVRDPE